MLVVRHLQTLCHRDINLQVHPGEHIAIYGQSGSGKSLLLRALADIDPHQGEVFLGTTKQSDSAPTQWRQQVGWLGAEYYFWHETAAGCLAHCDRTWIKKALDKLILPHNILARDMTKLSSGEKQRLALIRLLAHNPVCLLLDEPTTHLDAKTTLATEAFIVESIAKNQGFAIWVVHDNQQRQRIADRQYRLGENGLTEVKG